MKDTDFAYGVARIRAKEAELLTFSQLRELCYCKSYNDAIEFLVDVGIINNGGSVKEITDYQQNELWNLLLSCVPDKNMLDVFCVLNDFFNIKACVKCCFEKINPFDYYTYPTTLDLQELTEKVSRQSFNAGQCKLGDLARKALEIANITEKGHNAEIIIDKAAIDCLFEYSENKNNSLVNEICAFLCDTANIKIALRINALCKPKDFAEEAIGKCAKINRSELIEYIFGEKDDLIDYLCTTEYKDGVLIYIKNSSMYDKWCDECIISSVRKARFTAFGFDPICAYYYKKQNEIKNIRMILSAVKSGISGENTEKRIRMTDV